MRYATIPILSTLFGSLLFSCERCHGIRTSDGIRKQREASKRTRDRNQQLVVADRALQVEDAYKELTEYLNEYFMGNCKEEETEENCQQVFLQTCTSPKLPGMQSKLTSLIRGHGATRENPFPQTLEVCDIDTSGSLSQCRRVHRIGALDDPLLYANVLLGEQFEALIRLLAMNYDTCSYSVNEQDEPFVQVVACSQDDLSSEANMVSVEDIALSVSDNPAPITVVVCHGNGITEDKKCNAVQCIDGENCVSRTRGIL